MIWLGVWCNLPPPANACLYWDAKRSLLWISVGVWLLPKPAQTNTIEEDHKNKRGIAIWSLIPFSVVKLKRIQFLNMRWSLDNPYESARRRLRCVSAVENTYYYKVISNRSLTVLTQRIRDIKSISEPPFSNPSSIVQLDSHTHVLNMNVNMNCQPSVTNDTQSNNSKYQLTW